MCTFRIIILTKLHTTNAKLLTLMKYIDDDLFLFLDWDLKWLSQNLSCLPLLSYLFLIS